MLMDSTGCFLLFVQDAKLAVAIQAWLLRSLEDYPGVNVHGHNLTDIQYVDETVLIGSNVQDLRKRLNCVNERCQKFNMEINKKKTKIMEPQKTKASDVCVRLDAFFLERVGSFEYLGLIITSDGRCQKDQRIRGSIAKSAFSDMKDILCNLKMPFKLQFRFFKCCIYTVLLYGCEWWALLKNNTAEIEATELLFLKRMMEISWRAK